MQHIGLFIHSLETQNTVFKIYAFIQSIKHIPIKPITRRKTCQRKNISINLYFRELSMRRIIYATNCPCDELSVRRIVHATNCPCDELSATNCPCDELSGRRFGNRVMIDDVVVSLAGNVVGSLPVSLVALDKPVRSMIIFHVSSAVAWAYFCAWASVVNCDQYVFN